jgi:hypothetical protein
MGLQNLDIPTSEEKRLLFSLLYKSKLDYEDKVKIMDEINAMLDYEHYQKVNIYLESVQPSIHEVVNPSQSDINKHIKRFIS